MFGVANWKCNRQIQLKYEHNLNKALEYLNSTCHAKIKMFYKKNKHNDQILIQKSYNFLYL